MLKLKVEDEDIPLWVERGASFVQMAGRDARILTFAHQSARDFLARHRDFMSHHTAFAIGHQDMATRSLTCLSDRLTSSRSRCPSWGATRKQMAENAPELTTGLEYAAEHWTQHLEATPDTTWTGDYLRDNGPVHMFLKQSFLDWFACLGLADQLPRAVTGLDTLMNVTRKTTEVSRVRVLQCCSDEHSTEH